MSEKLIGERKWFPEAKFGMFVHFGLYTIMGKNENSVRNISKKRYASYMSEFDPQKFDAEKWVKLAVDSGARYITPTMKHAEGFCLWDSELTNFKITNTPFGRDILAELDKACDRRKLKLCVYYNPENWLYDGSDVWSDRGMSYPEFMEAQLREILTKYGEIGMIWFDHANPALPPKTLKKIIRMIHELQPSCVVNDRAVYDHTGQGFGRVFHGDFVTPERFIPESPHGKYPFIECCDAIGADSWGYCEKEVFWSVPELTRRLTKAASIGANYLLNVEPMPNGMIRPECVERMLGLGEWLKKYGEAVFGTGRCDLVPIDPRGQDEPPLGVSTSSAEKLYLHIQSWPMADEVKIEGVKRTPRECVLLNQAQPLRFERRGDILTLSGLPPEPPGKCVSVVRMEFSETPRISRSLKNRKVEVIKVRKGETIHLNPETAELTSPNNICWHKVNRFPNGRTSIGGLHHYKPGISWRLDLEEAGDYLAFAEFGAMDIQADSAFTVISGESEVRGTTWCTGDYSKPERRALEGKLRLESGGQKVFFKILDRPHGHFADIYRITLQPLK